MILYINALCRLFQGFAEICTLLRTTTDRDMGKKIQTLCLIIAIIVNVP